jgi:hypothetical protein
LKHVNLSLVHKLNQGLQIFVANVFEDDDGVLARRAAEKSFKVRAARGQDNFMTLDRRDRASRVGSGTRQGHVDERLVAQQRVEPHREVLRLAGPKINLNKKVMK